MEELLGLVLPRDIRNHSGHTAQNGQALAQARVVDTVWN